MNEEFINTLLNQRQALLGELEVLQNVREPLRVKLEAIDDALVAYGVTNDDTMNPPAPRPTEMPAPTPRPVRESWKDPHPTGGVGP